MLENFAFVIEHTIYHVEDGRSSYPNHSATGTVGQRDEVGPRYHRGEDGSRILNVHCIGRRGFIRTTTSTTYFESIIGLCTPMNAWSMHYISMFPIEVWEVFEWLRVFCCSYDYNCHERAVEPFQPVREPSFNGLLLYCLSGTLDLWVRAGWRILMTWEGINLWGQIWIQTGDITIQLTGGFSII